MNSATIFRIGSGRCLREPKSVEVFARSAQVDDYLVLNIDQ